jgi:hypothetical protein
MVTWSKFRTEEPQILDATVHNLVATANWHPGYAPLASSFHIITLIYNALSPPDNKYQHAQRAIQETENLETTTYFRISSDSQKYVKVTVVVTKLQNVHQGAFGVRNMLKDTILAGIVEG